MENEFLNRETELLYKGARISKSTKTPETLPLYMTTAFNVEDLNDLSKRYEHKDYTYIRTRNPNRKALSELVSYLENGENSLICPSGMAAISTTILTLATSGGEIIADHTLYGESIELLNYLNKFDIKVRFVNTCNLTEIKKVLNKQTIAIYTETISNPTIKTVDFIALHELCQQNGVKLIVDNTFATSYVVKPLSLGADIVVNSLTKFANGHSDVCIGSITSTDEFIQQANALQVLLGTVASPFDSWLCERGMRTMDLRLAKQNSNALALAKALNENPYVKKVNYLGLEKNPQYELAKRQFKNNFGGMLSFEVEPDKEKLNHFFQQLNFVHYAMTLGGFRTTVAHPASSSHHDMPRKERLKLGISDGLIRISTGIENTDDLLKTFATALQTFKE
jgi:cystathionine beta-lyase/cystathionine gamma-synthase